MVMPTLSEEEQFPLAADPVDLHAEGQAPDPVRAGRRNSVAFTLASLVLAGAFLCWLWPAHGGHGDSVARHPHAVGTLYENSTDSSDVDVIAVLPQSPQLRSPTSQREADVEQPNYGKKISHRQRRGSFLVIGDWGWDEGLHGNVPNTSCQTEIASKMLAKMEELGDVKFIINVGDSFYPEGLTGKDDPQWDTKWRNIYDPKLRSIPWYSVYGNHDYHHDPCACTSDPNECAQVNYNVSNLEYFYMPGYNWYQEHPELDLEVIGLDMNKFMEGWNSSAKIEDMSFADCQWSPCKEDCYGNSDARADQGFELFSKRLEESTAKNLLVFSHYPTDYFQSVPEFLRNLSMNDKHDINYFGGHRHNVDQTSTWQITPNTNWLVGGGGGWSCDGPDQGFVVGEIDDDYKITTHSVLVDYNICCPPAPVQVSA